MYLVLRIFNGQMLTGMIVFGLAISDVRYHGESPLACRRLGGVWLWSGGTIFGYTVSASSLPGIPMWLGIQLMTKCLLLRCISV